MLEIAIKLEHLIPTWKIGLNGPAAAGWLGEHGVGIPVDPLAFHQIDDDSFIARLGVAEFLLEFASVSDLWMQLKLGLKAPPTGVYCVPRSEATFLLSGSASELLFAQTCGIDFRQAEAERVIFTRVAGVNCGVLPISDHESKYRIWVDYTYARYLWDTLAGIVAELGGTARRLDQCETPEAARPS